MNKQTKRIMPPSICVYFNDDNSVVMKEAQKFAKENKISISKACFYLINLGLKHQQEINLPKYYTSEND